MSQSHGVKDLVISCIDYRFRPKVAAWIESQLQGQADLVAVAGASKSLTDNPARDYLFQQIEIGVKLHGVERIHILDHIDCGAYGGSKLHKDETTEVHFHTAQCFSAAEIIKEKFPQLTVLAYVVGFDQVVACQGEGAAQTVTV